MQNGTASRVSESDGRRRMNAVHSEASIIETSRLMRQYRATRLLVMAEADGAARPLGLVTADDIVTRVVAVGLDPAVLTAGDIASFSR